MTGGFIASYSLVDGFGARLAETSLGFYGCLSILNAVCFSVLVRIIRPGTVTAVTRKNYKLALGSAAGRHLWRMPW